MPTHSNDVLHGWNGADDMEIHASAGQDGVFGGAEADQLTGFDGNDLLSGGSGNDVLAGGAGDDSLDGGNLHGGGGNDQIYASIGADNLTGGGDVDRFVFTWGDANEHHDGGLTATARDVVVDFEKRATCCACWKAALHM